MEYTFDASNDYGFNIKIQISSALTNKEEKFRILSCRDKLVDKIMPILMKHIDPSDIKISKND